ncbi:MAG: hypothetical protein EBR79_03910, partial [Proteobacteria bacterium]|nr:hypothetical protein [Pseudomonadota bacterium]
AVVALAINPALAALKSEVLVGIWGWLQVFVGFNWPPKDVLAMAVLQLPVQLDMGLPVIGLLLLSVGLAAWALVGAGVRWAEASLALVWAVCLGLMVWGTVPLVWQYTQAPLARMALMLREIPAGVPIIHLGLHKPSVLYISDKRFLKLEKPLQLPEHIYAPETIVLTELPTVPQIELELAAQARGTVLHKQCEGGFCLLVVGDLQ